MTAIQVKPYDRTHWPLMPQLMRLPITPTRVDLPWQKLNGKPLSVWVHPEIAGHLVRTSRYVFEHSLWAPQRVDSFVDRDIAHTNVPSMHAAGLALDVFNLRWPLPVDPRGKRNAPPSEWLSLWEDCGWRLGAGYKRPDWPHIEWVRAKRGGLIKLMRSIDKFEKELETPLSGGDFDLWVKQL